jgi:hypothetical protein
MKAISANLVQELLIQLPRLAPQPISEASDETRFSGKRTRHSPKGRRP